MVTEVQVYLKVLREIKNYFCPLSNSAIIRHRYLHENLFDYPIIPLSNIQIFHCPVSLRTRPAFRNTHYLIWGRHSKLRHVSP